MAALVILRSASGDAPAGFDRITAANVAEYLPAECDVDAARTFFRDAGFTVGPIVGAAFSIEAAKPDFEQFFSVRLTVGSGGVAIAASNGAGGRELPLDAIPDPVCSKLVTVTFETPADIYDPGDGGKSGLDI